MAINVTGPGRRTKIEGTNSRDTLYGTDSAETILGHGGSDFIYASAGGDLIVGDDEGAYNAFDTVSYEYSPEGVQIDLNSSTQHGGYAEGQDLVSIEGIVGSNYNDTITGNGGDNGLRGGNGLDTISGAGGNDWLQGGFDRQVDILDGGSGIDTVDYSDASRGMTIRLDQTMRIGSFSYTREGSATLNEELVRGQLSNGLTYNILLPAQQEDTLRNIEDVIGTRYNDTITGNERANTIIGGAGADIINGLGGIDTVEYLDAADHFIDLAASVQHGGDAEGDQLVSIENVRGGAGRDTFIGNDADNILQGDPDFLVDADDTLLGGVGNDTLRGGGGDDSLFGGFGNDLLDSSWGADLLDGGADADTFVYNDTSGSGVAFQQFSIGGSIGTTRINAGVDTILNFQSGIDDIDLSGIDANRTLSGNQAFVFTSSFTGSAGQLILSGTTLRGDVDGDRIADLTINVAGAQRGDVIL